METNMHRWTQNIGFHTLTERRNHSVNPEDGSLPRKETEKTSCRFCGIYVYLEKRQEPQLSRKSLKWKLSGYWQFLPTAIFILLPSTYWLRWKTLCFSEVCDWITSRSWSCQPNGKHRKCNSWLWLTIQLYQWKPSHFIIIKTSRNKKSVLQQCQQMV